MKRKILTMLRENGAYVSGQQLCERLGVSRTAVWKTINALKAEGYEIEAVQNKGYCLLQAPDVLTEAEVGSRRTDRWREAPLIVYTETDSTNNQARRLAQEGNPEGTLVVADRQTRGKGRRGRVWETPAGAGIAMSFVLKPEIAPQDASQLTILAALASLRAVRDVSGIDCAIKWPNDLVLNRRKLCGILTEMNLEEDYIQQIVVGIGFNVHHETFPESLADKATSLYLETGRKYSRAEIVCRVMQHFANYYDQFLEQRNLAFVREEYNQLLISRGESVRVLGVGQEWSGRSLGINDTGSLLVETERGEIREVLAGEVSVRGLYSYA